ncbi:hypothetical protein ACFL6U_16100 [Planctomycetota bacterium]
MSDLLERFRLWLQENPKVAVGLASASVLLLVIVLVTHLMDGSTPPPIVHTHEWYYDLNTKALFTAAKGQTPPIDAPSGPQPTGEKAGVRAYVLTYVSDPNESERFLAFLETSDPSMIPTNTDNTTRSWGQGKLIRRVEDPTWVTATSRAGRTIMREAFVPDEHGETPYYFYPP